MDFVIRYATIRFINKKNHLGSTAEHGLGGNV